MLWIIDRCLSEFMYREQLLFVCSRNQWRSPTAAALFKDSDLYVAKSAGTSDNARIKITPGLINWADCIFVMEKRHAAILQQKYPDLIVDKSMVILHVSDDYQYMDPELLEILESRLAEYLG
ncbi:protein tyrosine phosphatase [Chamaesiphon sp. VAR_48_metabat_135_sub]|uniref:low molecular weight protein tyrosine phosphatase family protein n=1 Tax=Chamaesiphon sp. VAR_48_metabat_135_sub TaxID=2964699 RepID=UPI00286CA24C|nr:protein tyrosine phosphatase [Chamaesiphon sp. VAR_48_metabat_135_sub]